MGFVAVIKNKAYYKRYQVKFKRRRQCKTDYYARKRLIAQDKNKYKTPKYRMVVRFTNKDIIAQIVAADLTHDNVLVSAFAHELPRYGLKVGLTNYAAAYCVGLLLARRTNVKFGLEYEGNLEVDGEDYNVEAEEEGKAPFKALLDVGLKPTTTGSRLFGVVKGACDGGIDVPHNDRRFPGSRREGSDFEANPETHKEYIFGGHVAEYMRALQDDDEEAYGKQFSKYIKAGVSPDDLEGLYESVHKAIRADPNKKRADSEFGYFKAAGDRKGPKGKPDGKKPKKYNASKISVKQRMARIKQKLTAKGVESKRAGLNEMGL